MNKCKIEGCNKEIYAKELCMVCYSKNRYQKIKDQRKLDYIKNIDEMRQKHRKYYHNNTESILAQQKERRDRDNKEINEKRRENYINKKDKINAKQRERYKLKKT